MESIRILPALAAVVLLTACSVMQTRDIKGKWQKEGGKETLAFLDSGLLTMNSGQTELTTTYKTGENKMLQIDLGSLGPLTVQFEVSRENLTLNDGKGKVLKYTRVEAGAEKPAEKPQARIEMPQAPAEKPAEKPPGPDEKKI